MNGSDLQTPTWRFALVIGGARSGKSSLAEGLVTATGRSRCYIATSQPWDDEMRARIEEHRRQRGPGWRTVETPLDLVAALADLGPHEAALIDCATLWLTNLVLGERDVAQATQDLLKAIATCPAPVAIVTNEVGWGIVPDNALARRFRDAQGRLNQALAAQADLVVGVMAGLPFVLKGQLPGSGE